MFKKTLIIGLGLIGGSFAKALRQHGLSEKIFACDPDFESIVSAKNSAVIDEGKIDLALFEDELKSFDFIAIATPFSAYETISKKLSGLVSSEALMIDLGSIKDLNSKIKIGFLATAKNFIPCHPIAGSEKGGFENSSPDLFLQKKFIICRENRDENQVKKIISLVNRIAGKPDFLEAKKHDKIYGLVSHLPQFLSFLTAEFSPKNIKDDFFAKAFRLDNSSPEIWEEDFGIFRLNEKNLEEFYVTFFEELEQTAEDFLAKKFSKIFQELTAQREIFSEKNLEKFDEKFFSENFSAIFFRSLVALSYLKIPEVDSFKTYAGKGFEDFISIVKIVDFGEQNLLDLMQKNQQKISKILNSFLA